MASAVAMRCARRASVALVVLASGSARATPELSADLDGDGHDDQVLIGRDGHLSVIGRDGRPFVTPPPSPEWPSGRIGELSTDFARGARGAWLHARAERLDAPGRAFEVVWAIQPATAATPATATTVWAGTTGPRPGEDGESTERLRVDAEGPLRYQTAPGITRCDGFDLLFPTLWDPAQRRFRPVQILPPPAPPLVAAIAPPGAAPATLALFRFVAASTRRGDGGRAGALLPPRELDDGDAQTTWIAGLPGPARGAFVTARSRLPGSRVSALRIAPSRLAATRPPSVIALEVGEVRFRVSLPAGPRGLPAAWRVQLPQPVPAGCVSLTIVDGAVGATMALADVSIETTRDTPRALEGLAHDLAVTPAGPESGAFIDGAIAILGEHGAAAIPVLRAGLPGTVGEPRRRLVRAAIAAGAAGGAAGAGDLLAGELATADADERRLIVETLEAAAGSRGAGERALATAAVEPLLALALDPSVPAATRNSAIGLLGRLCELAAVGSGPVLRRLLDGVGATKEPQIVRVLVDLSTRAAPASLLPPLIAQIDAGTPPPVSLLRMLGQVGGRARGEPALLQPAVATLREVFRRYPGFAERFEVLRAARALASPGLLPLLAESSRSDDEVLRWAAAEAAAAVVEHGGGGSEILERLLGDPDPRVRAAALAGLPAPNLFAAAAALLAPAPSRGAPGPRSRDGWPMVRRVAAERLTAACPGEARPALERAIVAPGDPDEEVRLAALAALSKCAPPEADRRALGLLADRRAPQSVRAQAAVIAARVGGAPATAAIGQALEEESRAPDEGEGRGAYLGATLVRALVRSDGGVDERVSPATESRLLRAARAGSPSIRGAAVAALARLDSAAARAAVDAARSDPDPSVQRAAAAALTGPKRRR